jgi:uncharacterized protein with von Willebrand factor type A (vWA) domain
MDEVQEKLESIIDQERRTLDQLSEAGQDTQSKQQFLNDLPGKASDAVERLTSYRFENADAAKEFEELLMQLEQIRKLENWLRREGSLFRGQTPVPFEQSGELMEHMEDLRRLEGQLSSMQLKDVDKELLEKLLGGDPKQDFEGVMRMQSLLEEGGYVLEQGERFELTPKGVRRVGQLALRDIYQQLRREGSLFRGQTPMQFQQSQERMERMEDLRKLESQLSSMQLKDVDQDLLERLLGGDPKQDFEGVMRMQSLLEEGGYVLEQGERFELTPKGVRRVGQLALRDIYRQLRRDAMGRHDTRNRGNQELLLETSRPYTQGDPLHINMIQTLKNALLHGGGVPVRIGPKISRCTNRNLTRAPRPFCCWI